MMPCAFKSVCYNEAERTFAQRGDPANRHSSEVMIPSSKPHSICSIPGLFQEQKLTGKYTTVFVSILRFN